MCIIFWIAPLQGAAASTPASPAINALTRLLLISYSYCIFQTVVAGKGGSRASLNRFEKATPPMRHISPASAVAPMRPAAALSLSRQLTALIQSNDLAHRESDLEFFLQEICRTAAEGLDAGFVGVLQYRADEQAFVLQAGIGMRASLVGRTRIAADLGTTAGLAWHIKQPIRFRDTAAGGHLRMSAAATGCGVRRLVSVPVHGEGEEAFGVLEVGSAEAGEFAPCDLLFLRVLADRITEAVKRHADLARRADRATLVAERRRTQNHDLSDRIGRPTIPNAAMCRQAQTFGGLQQDAQIQEGNG